MKKIRCAIYDRVSTEIQATSGLSLDTQKELLTEYAESHGYEIVGYYADEGLTARKKLQNRKDFQRLLGDIQNDKIDLVLVTKLDRWFRNVRDYHNTQAILEEHHCNWKTILEDYDTSTADGQLKINIMLAVAQNESDRTSERIKVVFEYKKRNGEHLTGAAPYGYITVNKKLVKDPATEHIVNDLFRYYFLTFSKRQTILYITEKYGDAAPTVYQANRILKNETYAGKYQDNLDYCEPYISLKQFETINDISATKIHPTTYQVYLFSQLLICPACGAHLTGYVKKQKLKDGSISLYKRYKCPIKFSKIDHKGKYVCITESVIENYMLEHVYPELQNQLYKIQTTKGKHAKKKDATASIRAEMDRLNLMFRKGRISEDAYDTEYDVLEKKLKTEQERNKIVSVDDYAHIREEFSGNWKDIYQKLDDTHKRAFWRRTIKEIRFDENTHKISGFKFLI